MTERFAMCDPQGFAVNYEINPWMKDQVGLVDHGLACVQWQGLYQALTTVAEVDLLAADAAWPDLVFTANAGLPLPHTQQVVLSNFRHPQRQGEKPINKAWFAARGWQCLELPDEVAFEGAGDALFDSRLTLWVGGGPRSDAAVPELLRPWLPGEVHRLTMVNPAYYHLDTCFCPLPGGRAIYLPEAFDTQAQSLLQNHFGAGLLALTPEEGRAFSANAVCVGNTIFLNQASQRLNQALTDWGFHVVTTPLSEFMKSGGSAKCLTLKIGGW